MSETVSTFLLRRLRAWGVEQVFGHPGDGINGMFAAWAKDGAKDGGGGLPRFVQARHEEMAAFEAVGYAKFSGRLGACTATSGPGAIHLLNGLYDALLDHIPVLAVVGQTNRRAMGGAYPQEVDLMALFKDVCSNYLQMLTVPEQLPNLVDRAVRTALSGRVPTCIIVPYDVQELEYRPPPQGVQDGPLKPRGHPGAPRGRRGRGERGRAGRRPRLCHRSIGVLGTRPSYE